MERGAEGDEGKSHVRPAVNRIEIKGLQTLRDGGEV